MKTKLIMPAARFLMALMLTCTLLLPAQGFAQGRGHGRGLAKKSEKFINGHDARDGRWDGRGPRTGSIRNRRHHRSFYRRAVWPRHVRKGKKIRVIHRHRRF